MRLKSSLRVTLVIILSAVAAGAAFSTWQSYDAGERIGFWNVANGAVDAALIAGPLAFYTLVLCNVVLRRAMRNLSFGQRLLLNSAVYILIILVGRAFGRAIMGERSFVLFPVADPLARLHFFQAVGFAAVASILFHFMHQNNRLVGHRAFLNFLTGKYHRPVGERRTVMFMDLKGSTALAETLGDTKYLEFLREVFQELTDPILETRAEIYKYVGDEIILSWPEPALASGSCIEFWQLARRSLGKRSTFFDSHFGVRPEFRAGVHTGALVVGEIGDLKQEIVFIGDLMNTAARIASHTRSIPYDLAISEEAASKLPEEIRATLVPIGDVELRGKARPLALLAM